MTLKFSTPRRQRTQKQSRQIYKQFSHNQLQILLNYDNIIIVNNKQFSNRIQTQFIVNHNQTKMFS